MNSPIKNLLLIFFLASPAFGQIGPWNNPLMVATSADGRIFSTPTTFQDSSGVPSAIRWKGDTLICAFQWFRQPIGSPTWDRVAVKFSYNNGAQWTTPTPIVINALPADYQRPFDPTLVVTAGGSIRIYYSSSRGMPVGGLDSTVNTYSAVSTDGVHYDFEPGPRVDHPTHRVIDPAVIFFNSMWHYNSPIGAPQEGAFHYTSLDGMVFQQQGNYPSDNMHNWTGNYLVDGPSVLRFYGSELQIWYNTSADGFSWSGYVNTNVQGGDPTVAKLSSTSYLIIFVGPPYQTGFASHEHEQPGRFVLYQNYPNPFNPTTTIGYGVASSGLVSLKIFDILGSEVRTLVNEVQESGFKSVRFEAAGIASGLYFYKLETPLFSSTKKLILLR